jgi:hypothetical protein
VLRIGAASVQIRKAGPQLLAYTVFVQQRGKRSNAAGNLSTSAGALTLMTRLS